jgi:hypothetical protein
MIKSSRFRGFWPQKAVALLSYFYDASFSAMVIAQYATSLGVIQLQFQEVKCGITGHSFEP